MKRITLISLFTIAVLFALTTFFVNPAIAQDQEFEPGELPSAAEAGLRDGNLLDFISSLIRVFLGILGAILLLLIIYSGFLYATAAGDETKVTQARNTLVYAIIGVVIISAAWVLSDFIINNVFQTSL